MLVGWIGQGYVGKTYADIMEDGSIEVVRYALEEPYLANRDRIKDCNVVFIAVPTPTGPDGFDPSIVEGALALVGDGKIAVIKSTVLPGTTKLLQRSFRKLKVLCSPEFLSADTAHEDAEFPALNIVGIPFHLPGMAEAAQLVHELLPRGAFAHTCSSDEAEIIKYAHNLNGYLSILGVNLMYDLARRFSVDWEKGVAPALRADPHMAYPEPVHKGGRGAGGACFVKDIAALAHQYADATGDQLGVKLLIDAQIKNLALLRASGKDQDEVDAVYHHPKQDAA